MLSRSLRPLRAALHSPPSPSLRLLSSSSPGRLPSPSPAAPSPSTLPAVSTGTTPPPSSALSPNPSLDSTVPSSPTPSSSPQPIDLPPSPPLPTLEPEPTPEPAAPVARARRPVGAFRGGLIGFLTGVTLVGSYGYFQLLDDYAKASRELLASVEELKGSTESMASHISRISLLESTVSRLESSSAPKSDLDSLRQEYRKLLEAEHLDGLNVKAHVWALEQDLHRLSKRGTSVRI